MEIVRSKKAEAAVLQKVKTWLTNRPRSTDKWHVSDLLYPRKAYWQKRDPQPISDKQAGYFIAGIGHHSVVEAILGPKKHGERADAGEFAKHGILFSPDLRLPYPLEFKTSRRGKAPDDTGERLEKAYDGYLKQLTMYQALMGTERGALLVFYLSRRTGMRNMTEPAFRFYNVYMTKLERVRLVKKIIEGAKLLTAAVKKKNHKQLECCPTWMCRDCAWLKKCNPTKTAPKQ